MSSGVGVRAVKKPLRMPVAYPEMAEFRSKLCFQFKLSANTHLRTTDDDLHTWVSVTHVVDME